MALKLSRQNTCGLLLNALRPSDLMPKLYVPYTGWQKLHWASVFHLLIQSSQPIILLEMTCNKVASHSSTNEDGVELASVGKALPCCDIEIRDEDGQDYQNNQIGEIWVQSPSVMNGYLNDAPSSIHDGWLATGDLGFYFEEELYIYGRKKDVIVLGGQNHAPQDLEMAVDGLDGVRTGCTVAVSNVDSDGEQVFLFVETTTDTPINPELAELCKQAVLRETGVSCDLVVLLKPGTIPRTSSGKLRRRETLHLFETGNLLPPKDTTPILNGGRFGTIYDWTLEGSLAEITHAKRQHTCI